VRKVGNQPTTPTKPTSRVLGTSNQRRITAAPHRVGCVLQRSQTMGSFPTWRVERVGMVPAVMPWALVETYSMSETLDGVQPAEIARLRGLVASATVEVFGLPNSVAWRQISVALAADPMMTPGRQNELRPLVWRVRTTLSKHVKKHPGLSEAQLREIAAGIAATMLPVEI
jgi:hypothetical protein